MSTHVRFAVPFSWTTPIGRLVELLDETVASRPDRGLVVEVDPGAAPGAERLRQRGFDYVAIVRSPGEAAALAERGFAAEIADPADLASVASALDRADRHASTPLRAVLLVDVLERAVEPDDLLGVVAAHVARRPGAAIGATATNVTHREVAVALLAGRFAPLGGGRHHHTHRTFLDRFERAGFVPSLERHLEADLEPGPDSSHLVVGMQLGTFLRARRDAADPYGATVSFAALFVPGEARASADDDPAAAPSAGRPLVTVLAPADRPVGVPDTTPVVTYAPGTLGAAIESVTTDYLTILDGSESVGDGWITGFEALIRLHPGAIVRCGSLDGAWPLHDNQFGLLVGATAPTAAFALPTRAVRSAVRQPVPIDGRVDIHATLLELAPTLGLVDTGSPAISVGDGWQRAAGDDLAVLDGGPLLTPTGSNRFLADLLARVHRAAELELELREARERLDRRPVRLALRWSARVDAAKRRVTGRLRPR